MKRITPQKSPAQIRREVDMALASVATRSHAAMKTSFSASKTIQALSRRFAKAPHVRDTIHWISTGLLLDTSDRASFAKEIRDFVDWSGPPRGPEGEAMAALALKMAGAVESGKV